LDAGLTIAAPNTAPEPAAVSHMLLSDVEGALPTFAGGDDLYSVEQFFEEFERVVVAMKATEPLWLMFFRRSLRSVAVK